MAHLLIVDDEQSVCWAMSKLAEQLGHTASVAASAEQAFVLAEQRRPDAIVLDVRLPGIDGLTAMGKLQEQVGDVPIIVITAYGELSTAVQAVRNGAFEYLVKPFDLPVAQCAVERALQKPQGDSGGPALPSYREIIGSSSAIQEVFKRIAMVAPSEACVHLRGESGTGKELVARAIHRYSQRAEGPFVAVNVASLNPSLAESELFGHAKGAFTGAEHARKGLLEQADGGTLFLDEVADIPLSIQVKLLRVLEYGEIAPVGGDRPVPQQFPSPLRDASEPRAECRRGQLPPGSLLPTGDLRDRDSTAPRATRGHRRSDGSFSGHACRQERLPAADPAGGGSSNAAGAAVVRECPRVAECARARGHSCPRRLFDA